ncbi:hypothetical protein ACIP6P_00575 [Streptomyces sp. NPDC088729]|uniref:hypothetical protein n=1 Tax=Streptomyces sp. NPDC088729 TaxID=3365876 RepID=UPI0037FFC601
MAGIKLNLVAVHEVIEYEDRSIDVHATDLVRGKITIHADEDRVRWLWVLLDEKVKMWRRADGDD